MSACHVQVEITVKYTRHAVCTVTLPAMILVAVHGKNEANNVNCMSAGKICTKLCAIDQELWLYATYRSCNKAHMCTYIPHPHVQQEVEKAGDF